MNILAGSPYCSSNYKSQAGEPVCFDRLQGFIGAFTELLDADPDEGTLLTDGAALLRSLVSAYDWLPRRYALAAGERYSQYALYVDPEERFSVVSFVWGPGQSTPIHDHTTWGLIGMLCGAEVEQHYARQEDGTLVEWGEPQRLQAGEVDMVSPRLGDLHRVSNAFADRNSISIHVYGGNIGTIERWVYELDGSRRRFVSGYTDRELPELRVEVRSGRLVEA
jgi:predicted metal-dependent enzyme (double-stranded beta helix superfamily)